MSDALTYTIELAVGLGCLAAAVGLWRRTSLRALAVLFAIGGAAAAAHAAWALAVLFAIGGAAAAAHAAWALAAGN